MYLKNVCTCTCTENTYVHVLETHVWNDEERRRFWMDRLTGLISPTFVWRNARDLFTFSILCTRMRPLLGLASRSPEMISSSFSNFLPSARSVNKSSTSIRACEVKVIEFNNDLHWRITSCLDTSTCLIGSNVISFPTKIFQIFHLKPILF